jgi:NTF2 fold immunity protein
VAQPRDFDTLIAQSMEELRLKTQAHDATWHLGDADWSVDQNQGQIVFRHEGITATAPVQIIGTFSSDDSTWLWGWDHPSVVPGLQEHARRVLEYGKQNGIKRFMTRKLACSENEAWEFAAVACKLCGAQGAYRGPAGKAFVFMTFGNVTLTSSGPSPGEQVKAGTAKTLPESRLPVTSPPAQAVRAFIAAHYAWNTAANERRKSVEAGSTAREAATKTTTEEYDRLISRFCASSVKRQGISFGDDPSHHPDHETVESVSMSGPEAIVQTRKMGLYDFVSNYEYHLVKEAGEWRIASLLYVDDDGKYECL